jgi:hypothetical protein
MLKDDKATSRDFGNDERISKNAKDNENNKTNCNVIFLTMLKHISVTLPSNQRLHVIPKLACVSYVASQT